MIRVFVFLALASFSGSALGQPAHEFYLKVDDVKGSATSPNHKDQIVVTGFSVGTTNTGGAVGSGSGKASPLHLVVQKNIDVASPVLAQAAANGKAFNKVELFVLTANRGEMVLSYTVTLQDVRVAGTVSGGGIDNRTGLSTWTETVAFQYSKITWAFGSTKAGYDFAQNKNALVPQNSASLDAISVADAQATPVATPSTTSTVELSYSRTDASHVSLSFAAEAGKTYRVLGSANVEGPYELLTNYSAVETKPVVLSLAATAPTQFFRVEMAP
ncbi:MAG TPA: type VI secretion system tube protein Hcp [Verrucomicrobiae bacterium]|nr:type VI secretion system tube protein Hcp [Verrucomicrobiae bacterium]